MQKLVRIFFLSNKKRKKKLLNAYNGIHENAYVSQNFKLNTFFYHE